MNKMIYSRYWSPEELADYLDYLSDALADNTVIGVQTEDHGCAVTLSRLLAKHPSCSIEVIEVYGSFVKIMKRPEGFIPFPTRVVLMYCPD